ncbi:hypothetical protein [Acinetobacter baumannii]|uniref:hypothetical protein n=1 Tax=Acinetobacter baumannii TaxID=470 RepID=UPI003B43C861
MARARNIKPSFFTNDDLGEINPLARLLFIGMWTIADYKGCFEYKPKRLKVQILPYDNCDIEQLVNDLEKSGFISIYSVRGRKYIKAINFTKHQNPHKNEREGGSEIPDIDEADIEEEEKSLKNNEWANIENNLEQDGTDRADSLNLIPDSLNLIPSTPEPKIGKTVDEMFTEFWEIYPNKKSGPKAAKEKFKKINFKKHSFELIMTSLEKHIQSLDWIKEGGKFIPHATTWINQERWNADIGSTQQTSGFNSNYGYQSSHQQTISEQAKWDKFLNQNQIWDVTPKKPLLIEGVGHA